jgi:hypothetical protein
MVERKESLRAGRTVGSWALLTVVPLASKMVEELGPWRVDTLAAHLAVRLVARKVVWKVEKKALPMAIR